MRTGGEKKKKTVGTENHIFVNRNITGGEDLNLYLNNTYRWRGRTVRRKTLAREMRATFM